MPNTHSQNSDAHRAQVANHPIQSGEAQHADADGNSGSSPPPWYVHGLKFECTQCGDCCTGSPGAVWVTDEELTAIANHLGKTSGEVRLLYTKQMSGRWSLRDYPNGDCVFLDPHSRGCRVYSARPIQCRTWPFWPSNIESTDSWKRTCDRCPGSGTGMLYSLDIIQSQAAACEI